MTDAVRRKIAALLKMTSRAGCTEAEAMAAAEKAAALMAEYGLTEEEVLFGKESVRVQSRGNGARDPLWSRLADCTNTAVVRDWIGKSSALTFVGVSPGPEVAVYLYTVLNRAIDAELAGFKKTRVYTNRRTASSKRAAVEDFTKGMVFRLIWRLSELFRPSMSPAARSAAQNALNRFFPDTVPIKKLASHRKELGHVQNLGWSAGGKPQLAHGMAGRDGPKAIGGGG